MKHKVVLLFLCCIYINKLYAQNLTFSHYGLDKGMPQETVICITKDKNGFLWYGSTAGIARFDGKDFFIPIPDDNTNIDIAGYRVADILAVENIVYVATGQQGLLTYNLQTEAINQIYIKDSDCTSISSSSNKIVLATFYNKGVIIINNNKTIPIQFNNIQPTGLTASVIINDNAYIADESGNIYSFSLKNYSFNKVSLHKIGVISNKVSRLKTINNKLFICTDEGVYAYTNERIQNISVKTLNNKSYNPIVTDIVKKDSIYYIATNEGLLVCTLKDDSFLIKKHYRYTKKNDKNTINSNNINSVFIDNDLLYVGNVTLDIAELNNSNVFKNPMSNISVADASTFGVIDTDKYLFVGTRSNLVIINNLNKNYKILPHERIRGFIKDDDNNIWMSTAEGIYVIPMTNFNFKNPIILKVPSNLNNKKALKFTNIRSAYKDLSGNIWIVSYNEGFAKFTGNISKKDFSFINYSTEGLPSNFTLSLIQDNSQNYWMTTQKGLCKFSEKDGTIYIKKNYTEADGLATRGVLSSFISSDNTLWIASRKGLNKYHPKDDSFKFYNQKNGLTNNFVYHITEDSQKNLWLSTNGGLFKLNLETEEFINYSTKDGLQSTEFNLGAVYNNKSTHLLFFGGINGINIFNPETLDILDSERNLKFTDIKIKGNYISPLKNSFLNESITRATKIELNYNDFPIELGFSSLKFKENNNDQYVYKLVPDNNTWSDLGSKNNIQLLNLSPKTYTLEIQGKSRNKIWTKPSLKLTIKVSPPWYKSNVAYALYLLSFMLLSYLFYKLRLQRKLASQEAMQLKELDNLKSQFITNITHEFRTPLTLIIGYINTLKESLSENNNVKTPLKSIENNSNNLLNLVNEMLDLAKLEKGKLKLNNSNQDIIAFTKYIVNSFLSMADSKNIKLQFSSNIPSLTIDIDTEKIRQVISNLIANAIKFSNENKTVNIKVKKENKLLCIEVKDEGVGIAKNEISHVFDRFYQSDKNKNNIVGTGVGLALSKELISLMGGSINVVSKENIGSTFTIKLPITSEIKQSVTTNVKLDKKTLKQNSSASNFTPLENNKHKYTILIVEDNIEIANYIASCLNTMYNIFFAKNGQEGYIKAQKKIPDIIITDVMMPIMDGNELTKKLQETKITNHIPIIMLTAKTQFEDKLTGIKSGADVYLNKPFQKEELFLRIENLIIKRKKLQDYYKIENVVTVYRDKIAEDKNMAFLDQVIKLIHSNIDNSDLNSEKLASDLHMSESQLYRKLKAITNKSTAIFIRTVRLEKAKELLLTTNLSVSEISYATGFSNPNWFGKVFKETFGKNPTEIRQ